MYMVTIIKDKKLLLVTIIDLLITMGVPFLVRGICALANVNNFAYSLLFAIFAFFNGLFAYLVGDIILISYKHKHDLIDTPVPDYVALSAKHWRYPFIVCLLANVIIFVIFCIVYATTGHWPLM